MSSNFKHQNIGNALVSSVSPDHNATMNMTPTKFEKIRNKLVSIAFTRKCGKGGDVYQKIKEKNQQKI